MKDVSHRLEKQVNLEVANSSFLAVLQFACTSAKVSPTIDPKLLDSDELKNPVTLQLKKCPIKELLSEACRQAKLSWVLNPSLFITLPESKKE